MLERDQIIRIGKHRHIWFRKSVDRLFLAALVFHRFGQGYDIWVDNCQLFAQLLAEAIGGKENAAAIRHILNAKSLLKLPIAASWVAAPAYHIIAVLHHLLPKHSSPGSRPAFLRQADEILEKFENFFYHPRVYVGRRGV